MLEATTGSVQEKELGCHTKWQWTARGDRGTMGSATIRLALALPVCWATPLPGHDMPNSITGRLRLLFLTFFSLLIGAIALSIVAYRAEAQSWYSTAQGLIVLAALIVLWRGYLVARRHVVEPLDTLGEVAQRMAEGDFEHEIPAFADKESGRLAEALERLRLEAMADRRQLEDQVSRRTQELEAAFELSQEINAQLELDRLLESVTARARILMQGTAAALCLLDDDESALRLAAGSGEGKTDRNLRQPLSADLPSRVIGQGETVVSETACANCGFLRGLKSGPYVAAPLRAGNSRLGALCVARADWTEFEPAEQAAFSLLANAAAGAIVNARLAEDRRRQAEQAAVLGERERLAEELHDNLAQTLSFLNMKCDRLEELITAGATGDAERELAQMRGATTRAYGQVRAALTGLQAPLSEAGSFASQLASCVEEVQAATGLPIELALIDEAALALPALAQQQALHIVREALLNTWRHAAARGARVCVERENGETVFTVSDDGRGFDPEAVDETGHLGLTIMRERAERSGGSLTVDAAPGAGTRIVARFVVQG